MSTRGEGTWAGPYRGSANPKRPKPSLRGDKSRPAGGTGSSRPRSAFKMASPQGGQIAIAMRLRNQLQSVYKMDPLRNEVKGRQGYHCGRLAVRTGAGQRTGGGWPGAQCACAETGCPVRLRDCDWVAKLRARTPAHCAADVL